MSELPSPSPRSPDSDDDGSSAGDGEGLGVGKTPDTHPLDLAWTTRPLDGAPMKRVVIFAVAFLAMGIGWFGFGKPLFGILGFAMILGATADAWMGTRFLLDAKGASAKTGPSVTAMEWASVKRVLVKGDEIRLSPLETASTLDAFRGVGLVTTAENRESVLAFVRLHAPEAPLQ